MLDGRGRMMLVGMDAAAHCGCRILHEVAAGTVVLRIHAGMIPERPSRDEPVQFMLTLADVDVLRDYLLKVRGEMADSDDAAGRVVQLHRKKETQHG